MSIVVKPYTFSPGGTIIAAEHNSNFDTIYSDYNGSISNTNIATLAAIANTKLNLNGITGTLRIGASPAQGDLFYDNGTQIAQLAKSATATRYLSNTGSSNNPAWAQINIINGLTIASQAQGDIIYADSATTFARLAPGVSGQVLKTQGAAANPVWGTATDINTSNVIFAWSGNDNLGTGAGGRGISVQASSLTPSDASGASYIFLVSDKDTFETLLNFRFVKIAGISTVTINARLWAETSSGTAEAVLSVDIGGVNNTVKSTTSSTPTWVTVSTIDVSALVNGTTYDGIVQLKNETNLSGAYCSAVILTGS